MWEIAHVNFMVNPRRRVTDNPDWKQVAPRWILILGVLAGGVLAVHNGRAHIIKTDASAEKITVIENKVARFEYGLTGVQCQLLHTRIDMLSYQFYMAERNKDERLAAEVGKRLRLAEKEQDSKILDCPGY